MMCYACGEDALLEVDGSAGNSVCTRCGTVLEENTIVSEITFGETGGGAAMVQGSYVGADQTRARAPAGYRQKGGGQESREQTILNGRRRIQTLATALRLPDRLSDAGQRYFNLAVNMNFVQGRRTQYVVAACLYSACRMDKTSHMLIDFSDLLEINVFVLGSTYLKLVRELSLQLPFVDPSIYISRFAALLEFGDETQKVAQDAVRLVSRMGRDWMQTGRRPAGICGACLLLAARMNNFRRSITEVVQVVKIADVTLRKRLGEFKETASGGLTVADFRTLWLDEVADPPAFTEGLKREQKLREKMEAESMDGDEERDEEDEEDEERGGGAEDEDETGVAAFKELAERESTPVDPESEDAPVASTSTSAMDPPSSTISLEKRRQKRPLDAAASDDEDEPPVVPHLPQDFPTLDEAIASELNVTLASETGKLLSDELDKVQHQRIEAAGKMTNINRYGSWSEEGKVDTLDDLDEDELDCFILTEEEVEKKSRLWMELNREYLQNLADKQTGPDGEIKPAAARRIRKRHRPLDSTNAPHQNAAESMKQMMVKKKRFSKKINYAAIEHLFDEGDTPRGDDDSLFNVDMGSGKKSNKSKEGTPVGTPIRIPRPTFSRAGSVASSVRSSSSIRRPATVTTKQAPAREEPVEDDDEDEDEDDEEGGDRQDDVEDWRQQLGVATPSAHGGDDDDGYPGEEIY